MNYIYCINPDCKQRKNSDSLECCQTCGTPLLIHGRYRLLKPLRPFNPRFSTDIFEIADGETLKVMKVLKDDRPQMVEMLEREAATLQRLDHPGIPKVEIDGYFTVIVPETSQELCCLVMEKIEGENLEEWVAKNGKISQALALNWLRQLIEILDVLHQNKFFHRDIKPSNIMRKPDGQLVLIDFGTVREITRTYLLNFRGGNATTFISGGYTPPEQIDGRATPQSDLYALGRTFVYLLTGTHPLDFPKKPGTGQLQWRDRTLKISQYLADFIDELMAMDEADRPLNATTILPYLTLQGMFIRRALWLLNSRKARVIASGLLTLGISSVIFYRLSFPAQSQYFYELGVKEQNENKLDRAREYYEKALYFNRNDSRIYNNLGVICKKQKDAACAQKNYNQALKLDTQNPVARYNLGGFYEDMGDLERAEEQYQAAMQSEDEVAVNATNDLAHLKILQGDPKKAIELALQGLQRLTRPQVQSALYKNLGWARFLEQDYRQAEADLRRAIQLNSDRTDTYCLLAQVLEARGDRTRALETWRNCLQGDPQNRLDVKIWQTMARQRLRNS